MIQVNREIWNQKKDANGNLILDANGRPILEYGGIETTYEPEFVPPTPIVEGGSFLGILNKPPIDPPLNSTWIEQEVAEKGYITPVLGIQTIDAINGIKLVSKNSEGDLNEIVLK